MCSEQDLSHLLSTVLVAAARGIYIDRSQSLNIHMVDATTHDVLHVMGRRILLVSTAITILLRSHAVQTCVIGQLVLVSKV